METCTAAALAVHSRDDSAWQTDWDVRVLFLLEPARDAGPQHGAALAVPAVTRDHQQPLHFASLLRVTTPLCQSVMSQNTLVSVKLYMYYINIRVESRIIIVHKKLQLGDDWKRWLTSYRALATAALPWGRRARRWRAVRAGRWCASGEHCKNRAKHQSIRCSRTGHMAHTCTCTHTYSNNVRSWERN